MRLLLGSGGFRSPERVGLLGEQMRSFFGPIEELLFIPYALKDQDTYAARLSRKGLNAGIDLRSIHLEPDPAKAIEKAEGVYVGGGNSFRLLNALYQLKLLDPIRQRVGNGMPYLGISAGSNLACPTLMTTNDMPIVRPPSFRALGLVPFQINAHYFPGNFYLREGDNYAEHYGETRDDRIREFHEMNDAAVIGLPEGSSLRVEGSRITLIGGPARLFIKGRAPVDLDPGEISLE